MFCNNPFPWVLPAISLFAVVPNTAALARVVFAFLRIGGFVRGSPRNRAPRSRRPARSAPVDRCKRG